MPDSASCAEAEVDTANSVANEMPQSDSGSEAVSPLRSVHTDTFPQLLTQLNASLVVSTYQAGRLILLRPDGEQLNTHFRNFSKPMGVAIVGDRMAVGTAMEISEFHNVPAAAARADMDRPGDACFLPRGSHVTGDIQIHEMEWGHAPFNPKPQAVASAPDESSADDSNPDAHASGSRLNRLRRVSKKDSDRGEWEDSTGDPGQKGTDSAFRSPPSALDTLWFVNTRFSCLCTRSTEHSFAPQWRPPFVSAYTPEDRCHLNGLAMVDGQPKYVTALGESDTPAGWRDNKASGGILMDVDSGEIICRGLSMPHSPRFYNGKLWVLNSGDGGFGIVDPSTGKYEQIAELPGFTRGLSFLGRFAFIGLSQVRESAVFSGIRIAERPEEERWSGVAVVDITTGKTVAWLRFEDAVQEVFAVGILPGRLWPDLINDNAELIGSTWILPDEALEEVPNDWRNKSESAAEAEQ